MKKFLLISMFPVTALASSPCDYRHEVVGKYTKEITKVENIDREVFADTDTTRKCMISLDAWVDGAMHTTEGSFSFGPDISENTACAHAEQRAKENLIRKISPEILTANTNMTCRNPKDPSASQPQVAVYTQPQAAPQRVYGVIPNQPVYTIHSNRVQFEANPKFVRPRVYQSQPPVIQPYLGR